MRADQMGTGVDFGNTYTCNRAGRRISNYPKLFRKSVDSILDQIPYFVLYIYILVPYLNYRDIQISYAHL